MERTAAAAGHEEALLHPEGTPLLSQLLYFRNQSSHTGFVVDEYGVFQGIVTLHDILEEVVGEMGLDSDARLAIVYPQADDSYIIDASASVHDINRCLHCSCRPTAPTR